MSKDEIIKFLKEHNGYLKKGKLFLANKFNCSVSDIENIKSLINSNENTSIISDFKTYLNSECIDEKSVSSVKYWQTNKGETRYSVVVNNNDNGLDINDVVSILKSDIEPIMIPIVEYDVNKTLVVYTSDKHIGAKVGDNAMYENKYNAEEFKSRMIRIFEEITDIYLSEGVIKKIVVCDLGDSLDGLNSRTTRGSHILPQNMSNTESFNTFVNIHKQFYEALFMSEMAESYEVYHATCDNHSGEFSYFANRCLEEYFNVKFPQVKFNILTKFISHVDIGVANLLLCHGKDDEDMKNGLPLLMDAKTEKYILDYVLYNEIPMDNLCFIKGDLHQASSQQGKHFKYRNIPSIFGSSKWVMTNFNYTRPGCSFDLFHKNNVKEWNIWF